MVETALDDFLNIKDGTEIPPALQKPQALLKLPKGAMSIFIDEKGEAVYRYDEKCYENRKEDAITNLVFLLRLKEYLEVVKHLKPILLSKAYDDDIFAYVIPEPIAKMTEIEDKIKFEELPIKIEICDKNIKIRDLNDFEPRIPNEIVEEAIYRKDFCFTCNIGVEDGYKAYIYNDEEFGGAIICYNCFEEFQGNVEEANEVEEKPAEEQMSSIEEKEKEELRKYEERQKKKYDNLTKEERLKYFEEQWSSFWNSLKEQDTKEAEEEKKVDGIEEIILDEDEGYVVEEYLEEMERERELKAKEIEKEEKPYPIEEQSTKIIKISFNNPKEFVEILKMLEVINDEAFFTLNNNGLQYCQMDPAHISLISVKFKAKYESIEECKFSIYLDDFLKYVNNEELKNSKGLILEIDLVNKKVRFYSNTINIETEFNEEANNSNIPEPKLTFEVEAEIDLRNLLNAIKGFETIKISVENDRLFVDGRNEIVKKKTFIPSKMLTFRNGTLAYYNANYLEKFLKKAIKLKNFAKLSFSHNKPLCIEFETKIAKINYYLAPKVEE